jgi:hypothetical protein
MNAELALLIWVASFAALLYQAWRGKAPLAGMALCYWLNLASVHLLTEGLCVFHTNTSNYRLASGYGFPLSAYAILGLMAGNLLLAQPLDRLLTRRGERPDPPTDPDTSVRMAQMAIVVGMVVFLVGNFLNIPSLSAILASGNVLAIAGFIWLWWDAYRKGRHRLAWGILVGSLSVPFAILVLQGFLSFGVFAGLALVSVVTVRFRHRAALAVAAVPLLYLGLSTCVTYLAVRGDIRQSVWKEEAELSERAGVIGRVFTEGWRWFDPTDEQQRLALDARFNQNYFVGLTALRIDGGQLDYARGETVTNAALALIPRFFWRDKPVFVGGSENMSRFTGKKFAPNVTFGIGHVLEAYANFGRVGLVLCFLVLGALIGLVDRRAGRHLLAGRLESFLLWFVPGTALLNGSVGSFPELTAGCAGGVVLVWLFLTIFRLVTQPAPDPFPAGPGVTK